jgi:two-component system, LuxR family, sensor kinase FixL
LFIAMSAFQAPLKGHTGLVRQGYLRQIGTPTLIGSVVLLISALLLLGANVSALRNSFAWVQRTDDVLVQLSEVELRLVGNELTVRGYALTDDPVFLTYQKSERDQMAEAMRKLAALIADEPSQKSRFAVLRGLVDKRMAHFAYLTSLGPGHAQEVAVAIRDPQKRTVMRAARAQVIALRAEELKLLANRQAAVAQQSTRAYQLAIGIVLLAFVFGGLGLAFAQMGRGLVD